LNDFHSPLAKLAILTISAPITNISAFQPPKLHAPLKRTANTAIHEKAEDSATAPLEAATDWIKEDLEKIDASSLPEEVKKSSSCYTSSKGLLDGGRIVGPQRVLVYDTTLRGELNSY
jgi:hypothetical protein